MRDLKILLLILTIVLTNTVVYSQTRSDSCNYEIGIGVPYFPGTFSNWAPFPDISFKVIHNKNALRVGLIYDLTAPRPLNDYCYLLLNAGYERRFFKKNSRLLLGIDICYLRRFNQDSLNPLINMTFYHIGIGPVIGYLYKFSKRFSFQTELGLFYGYGENRYYNNGIFTNGDKGGYYTGHRFFSLNLFYQIK